MQIKHKMRARKISDKDAQYKQDEKHITYYYMSVPLSSLSLSPYLYLG